MKLIEPRTLKGFRDYLPREQITRARFIETIKKVFERFGFEPLETPVLEYEDVLTGKYGEEGETLMYRFQDHGKRHVAMRYDLTVPLARVAAQYQNDLPRPFKRYQVAPVWRADNTQKGRYREFYQCDADIVGADVGLADAECIAVIEQVLLELGIKRFTIKVSNRKLLNAIMLTAKIPASKIQSAIRSIDKLEKVGAKAVAKELVDNIGIAEHEAEAVIRLASTKVPDVGALKTFANKHILKEKVGKEGFDELNKVFEALHELGVKHAEIDLSLARGLDYYTSTIFEAVITESTESRRFGSVTGGGRYDRMLSLFTGKDMPAVGLSVGLDRLFAAMEEMGLIEHLNVVQVLVLNMDKNLEADYLKIVTGLRKAGINSEVYYEKADFKKQFTYAEKKSIPYAVIYGEDEHKKGVVVLRNLLTRKQETFSRKELAKKIKKILK
jgi:histidyl-tRNA synthetase